MAGISLSRAARSDKIYQGMKDHEEKYSLPLCMVAAESVNDIDLMIYR